MSKIVYKVLKELSIPVIYISACKRFIGKTHVTTEYEEGRVNTAKDKKYPWLFVFDNKGYAIAFANSFLEKEHYSVWRCITPRTSKKLPSYANPKYIYPPGTIFCKELMMIEKVYETRQA